MDKLHTVVNKSPGFSIIGIILVDAVICGARQIQNRAAACVYSEGSLHEDQMVLTQSRRQVISMILCPESVIVCCDVGSPRPCPRYLPDRIVSYITEACM